MTVLILAGTGDARQLAQFCADHNIAACASLAGATRQPKQLAVPTYHGGFGGGDGYRAFLKRREIRAVLDATHPFAHQITRRSHDIAREMGLPYMRFERPAWQPGPGDHWISLHDESEAAAHIAQKRKKIFLRSSVRGSLTPDLQKDKLLCSLIELNI